MKGKGIALVLGGQPAGGDDVEYGDLMAIASQILKAVKGSDVEGLCDALYALVDYAKIEKE